MREMKNSGVAWIGDVPENWETIPNKYLMRKVKAICQKYSNEDVLSLTMNGVIKRDLDNPSGKMPSTFDGYQFVYAGNLLMCLFDIDVTPRCIGLIENDGITSPAYSQFELKRNAFNRYYYYYYLYLDNKKELLHLAKNLRHSFTEEQFGQISTVVPPIEQQHLIANQLDFVCKKVEDLISNQEQQIEKLKQYKQSLITEVVTKGLNHDVPMKDSGTLKLGSIPDNWKIVRFKNVAILCNGKEVTSNNGNIPVYGSGGVFKYTDQPLFTGTSLLLGRKGTIDNPMLVTDSFWTVDTMFYTSKIYGINPKYLYYACVGEIDFNYYKTGSVLPSMTQTEINNIFITCPDKFEQKKIVDFLDKKCTKIDRLIAIKQEKINKLNDYKKSLIYEYVTGKKEVC